MADRKKNIRGAGSFEKNKHGTRIPVDNTKKDFKKGKQRNRNRNQAEARAGRKNDREKTRERTQCHGSGGRGEKCMEVGTIQIGASRRADSGRSEKKQLSLKKQEDGLLERMRGEKPAGRAGETPRYTRQRQMGVREEINYSK